jgi:hypothetical protein
VSALLGTRRTTNSHGGSACSENDAQPFHRADAQQPASLSVGRRSCQTLGRRVVCAHAFKAVSRRLRSGLRINHCSAARPASETSAQLGRGAPNVESNVGTAPSKFLNRCVCHKQASRHPGRPNRRVLRALRTRGRTQLFQSVEGASRRRAAPGSQPVPESRAPRRSAVSPPNSVAYAGTRQEH